MTNIALRPTGRTDTVVMTFDVVHDPSDDTRFDIEWTTYNWHKPLHVDARWIFTPDLDAPWTIDHVTVHARTRDGWTRTSKLSKNPTVFKLCYGNRGTRYDNLRHMPAWLAESLAVSTPTHRPVALEDSF